MGGVPCPAREPHQACRMLFLAGLSVVKEHCDKHWWPSWRHRGANIESQHLTVGHWFERSRCIILGFRTESMLHVSWLQNNLGSGRFWLLIVQYEHNEAQAQLKFLEQTLELIAKDRMWALPWEMPMNHSSPARQMSRSKRIQKLTYWKVTSEPESPLKQLTIQFAQADKVPNGQSSRSH